MVDPLQDLRSFIAWQEQRGRLLRVRDPLSPILEIPAFLRRIMYIRGPTVLFESVKGYPGWRVVGNVYDSLETLRLLFSVGKLEEIGSRLVEAAAGPPPLSFKEKISRAWEMKGYASYLPKKVRRARFTENVVEDNPLDHIPAFKTWPKDGSRYITFGLVTMRDPEKGVTNMGVYRVMLVGPDRAVVHWQIHKRGAQAYDAAKEKKQRLPLAIVIGSDPGTMFTGVAPVPYPMDKLLFAGMVRGKGVEVYELPNGVLVPANAEVVIEGWVDPGELSSEGPFGDHWGFYDKPVERYPVMHVERVYYRDDPVYAGTIVGLPPLEDAVIGKAIERIFLPIVKMILPEVVDMNLPEYGVFQGLMIVSIKKRYPGHGKKVMQALWGIGQTSLTKIIVVVDDFVDVHDINQVMWAITSFVNPQRDVLVVPYSHTDALDPAATAPGYGSKLGIDATRKFPEESGREPPEIVEPDPDVEAKIDSVLERLGLEAPDPWTRLVEMYKRGTRAG